MSLDFRVALLPYKSSSFATPLLGRATKGKRLYGQSRRLTSPDLHILCRMCTVGLWVLGSGVNLSLWQQRRENHTTGLAPVEMHPFCRLSATSLHGKASHTIFRLLRSLTNRVRLPPRRGRFALCSTSGLISISRHNAAKTSPSGGRTAAGGDRGAFSKGEAQLYGFRCLWQRCRQRRQYTHRREAAIPQPSAPKAPPPLVLTHHLSP